MIRVYPYTPRNLVFFGCPPLFLSLVTGRPPALFVIDGLRNTKTAPRWPIHLKPTQLSSSELSGPGPRSYRFYNDIGARAALARSLCLSFLCCSMVLWSFGVMEWPPRLCCSVLHSERADMQGTVNRHLWSTTQFVLMHPKEFILDHTA